MRIFRKKIRHQQSYLINPRFGLYRLLILGVLIGLTLCGGALSEIYAYGKESSLETKSVLPLNGYSVVSSPAGEYLIYVLRDGEWDKVGALSFDKYLHEGHLNLDGFITGGKKVIMRIDQKGGGAAHIDAVFIGDKAPDMVDGVDDLMALQKISSRDFDVLDAYEKSLKVTFPDNWTKKVLSLTARVEDTKISEIPFQYPLTNLYKDMNENSDFYSYKLLSGSAENDQVPLFKEYSLTGSGHPSGFTYGWVKNDDDNLYVKIDFTPDNTMDGGKDYAKVYVKTDNGLKEFKASVPETKWGSPDFTYTDKVTYQHKVYDFSIPLKELGLGKAVEGKEIPLAFAAYGTATPAWTIDKSAVPTSLDLLTGDSGIVQYEIVVQNVLPDETYNVDDTNGNTWQFTGNATVIYAREYTCDGDEGVKTNQATIREIGLSNDADVTVNCYQLAVNKDVNTAFTRSSNWTIDKYADQTDLTLSKGQQFLVNYQVVLDSSFIDSNWAASGTINIFNENPSHEAQLTSVTDIISPDIAANISCPSLMVPSGGSLSCTYSVNLPDASSRVNTAVATLQNFGYNARGEATPTGTTDFTVSADVIFSDPSVEIDKCVDASDTNVGFLGTFCDDTAPIPINYSMFVGPYNDCGNFTVENTASFVTNDTGTTDSDDWTVNVSIPCDTGCTLSPGYWKTHSEYGPAPYDDTWEALPDGADTLFFLSGQTYYEVLWTPPGGNAYYILARAFIAAQLNQLNGASISDEVLASFSEAIDIFQSYTPDEIAQKRGSWKQVRTEVLSIAGLLDYYNNGEIGPGHCSE